MRHLVGIGILLLALLAMRPAHALELPGQDDPAFQEAMTLWLVGDEAESLPALAGLAQGGNASARILLALIDKNPALQGPWLARLPREQRWEMMRAQGGISGISWMRHVQEEVPLAALWVALWSVDATPDLVIRFAAAGEARAAREAAATLAARGRHALSEIFEDPAFPQSMQYLVWREWQFDPAIFDAIEAGIAALPEHDPQRVLMGVTVTESALADWLMQAPEAAGLRAMCDNRCSQSGANCVLASYKALGGYAALMTFGSPSERLIPAAMFRSSPRGESALLRRILLNADARGRRHQLAQARVHDACFADLLEAEVEIYMPRRD